jgi:hypothetical protein
MTSICFVTEFVVDIIMGRYKIRRNGRNSHITREIFFYKNESKRSDVDIRVMTSLWHALHRDVFSNELFKIVLQ